MEGTAQKKARQEEPDASRSDVATQSDENTRVLDVSNYLTYDILRIVFQYLNARDLQSAAIVCRSWLEAANNEKGTRGPCCFNIFYKNIMPLRKTQRISDSNDICRNIKNIRIKPLIGFFFIPDCNSYYVKVCIKDLLPEHCEAVILHSQGIIMDNAEMEDRSSLNNIVCAFLPQIPNVKMKLFKMADYDYIQKSAEYRELINTIKYETSRSNYETSTCIMLFCNYMRGCTTAKRWATAIQQNTEEIKIVSVWGGLLNGVQHKMNKYFERTNCVAVLITGVIQTWSIILEEKCNTKEQVEARLKVFKTKVKLKKHSIGFIFVCKARGLEMYNENNVESTIFKKLFPKVPLVGCFGYGEFGKTTVVNEEDDDEENYKPECWYNEFSTVFLILTYG